MVRNNKGARAIANDAWEAEEEDELSFPKGAEITDIVNFLLVLDRRPTESDQPARHSSLGLGGVELMNTGGGFSHNI